MVYLVSSISEGMFYQEENILRRTRLNKEQVGELLREPFIAADFPTQRYPIWETLNLMEEEGIDTSKGELREMRLRPELGDSLLVVRLIFRKENKKALRFTRWQIIPNLPFADSARVGGENLSEVGGK